MKIYEYAVLLHPTKEEKEQGLGSTILVPITSVLAADEGQAGILAARAIPEAELDKLNRIEVAVRPF